MILIIDNYDSFTYNLVQDVGSINKDICLIKNNDLSLKSIQELDLSHIIISPGPGHPKKTGVCKEVIEKLSNRIPTMGICLGHQLIGHIYNAEIVSCDNIIHGKISKIRHNNKSIIFKDVPTIFNATRYHSLAIKKEFHNPNIHITAYSDTNEIMAIEHKELPIYGVQFHPESILTDYGKTIIENFLNIIV